MISASSTLSPNSHDRTKYLEMAGIKGHAKLKYFALNRGSQPWLTSKPLGSFVNTRWMPPSGLPHQNPTGGGVKTQMALLPYKFPAQPSRPHKTLASPQRMPFPLPLMTQHKHFSLHHLPASVSSESKPVHLSIFTLSAPLNRRRENCFHCGTCVYPKDL